MPAADTDIPSACLHRGVLSPSARALLSPSRDRQASNHRCQRGISLMMMARGLFGAQVGHRSPATISARRSSAMAPISRTFAHIADRRRSRRRTTAAVTAVKQRRLERFSSASGVWANPPPPVRFTRRAGALPYGHRPAARRATLFSRLSQADSRPAAWPAPASRLLTIKGAHQAAFSFALPQLESSAGWWPRYRDSSPPQLTSRP